MAPGGICNVITLQSICQRERPARNGCGRSAKIAVLSGECRRAMRTGERSRGGRRTCNATVPRHAAMSHQLGIAATNPRRPLRAGATCVRPLGDLGYADLRELKGEITRGNCLAARAASLWLSHAEGRRRGSRYIHKRRAYRRHRRCRTSAVQHGSPGWPRSSRG